MKRLLLKKFRVASAFPGTSGFTLVELLVAIAITGIVISAAGFGLVNILQANKKAEAATERRRELNRALDFIAEEVKMASNIRSDVGDSLDVSAIAPNFNKKCNDTADGLDCGLVITIPGLSQPIIYYVVDRTKLSTAQQANWRGARVIYRWGPSFEADGTYGSNKDNPENWTYQPLIDSIEGDLGGTAYKACPSGWSPSLDDEDKDSFYACVNPSNNREAEIYLLGKHKDSNEHYVVNSRVFARSSP